MRSFFLGTKATWQGAVNHMDPCTAAALSNQDINLLIHTCHEGPGSSRGGMEPRTWRGQNHNHVVTQDSLEFTTGHRERLAFHCSNAETVSDMAGIGTKGGG